MRKTLLGLAGALALAAPGLAQTTLPDLFALKVKRAETVSGGVIEHAVILIENGKIVTIGQDLEIERGIPVIDRSDMVVTPGFVNCYSRLGKSGTSGGGTIPSVQAATEVYAPDSIFRELLEVGVTTIGFYPPGSGIPGQAVALSTAGTTKEEMVLAEGAYLKIAMRSNSSSRKMLEGAFEKVDEHKEKVEKAREKWQKTFDKWEKDSKKKKKDDDDKKEADPKPADFVAPDPDHIAGPFIDVLAGDLPVMFTIRKAGDYLHLERAIGDKEFQWSLRVPLRNEVDLYNVAEQLGEAGRRVILEPMLTTMAWTQRQRNIPAELASAGAHVAFVPKGDDIGSATQWRLDVGHLVRDGMDHDAALAAMTLEPSLELGLGDRLGSLEAGKDANILFFNGDPFQASTTLVSVMSGGKFVEDEE